MKETKGLFFILICFFFSLKAFGQVRRFSPEELRDSTETKKPQKAPEKRRIYLDDPYKPKTDYDWSSGTYKFRYSTDNQYDYKLPSILSREEYIDRELDKNMEEFFADKTRELEEKRRQERLERLQNRQNIIETSKNEDDLFPSLKVNSKAFEKIFGGNEISLQPTGALTIDIAGLFQTVENPQIPQNLRSTFTLDFDQNINIGMSGKVGERINLDFNFDNGATFGFQNQLKVGYQGDEDNIIKAIELGNISMPLRNSLMQGAQDLFGVRTDLQFGKTFVSAAFSQQRSESKNITIENGEAIQDFELFGLDYEENAHYFLAQYFRDNYDTWLQNYPFISSGININRVEVWVVNVNTNTTEDNRSFIALADLGENQILTNPGLISPTGQSLPSFNLEDSQRNSNNLFTLLGDARDQNAAFQNLQALGFRPGIDFSNVQNAKLLNASEYTMNNQLGYISLNQPLEEDQVLAVAFQYTVNGRVYQVGEFSNEISAPDNLFLKLLKSDILNVEQPSWDLMMKNVYSLNSYGLQQENFQFDVLFRDDRLGGSDVNFFQNTGDGLDQLTIMQILNMDRLNKNGDPVSGGFGDGLFDYINGITVNSQNSRIIFTKVEPFGGFLESIFTSTEDRDRYVFSEMYTTTKTQAEQIASEKNKYILKGRFQSSGGSAGGSGISLGAFNVPRGSVRVTAGGRTLTEGVDYIVDYQIGEIQIINSSVANSGIPVQVSIEDNSAFNLQTKRFIALDVEHRFSENFFIGGTYLNYRERPVTQKANFGVEPVNNSMFGLNGQITKEVPFLTKLANKLPFVDTDAPSSLTFSGEFATLTPNQPTGIELEGEAVSYVDDFENTQIDISLNDYRSWRLASVPGGDGQNIFNGNNNDLSYGYDRGLISWYTIDPLFYGLGGGRPGHITDDDISLNNARRVSINELFPQQDIVAGSVNVLNTFDITFDPTLRGPYNYDPAATNGIPNPQDAWGGIMRSIQTNNFELANVETVEFWVLDPFSENPQLSGGDVYLHLGNMSEDVLRDGRKQYENGLPEDGSQNPDIVDETIWGVVPENQSILYAFSNEDGGRANQDLGLDGLNNESESNLFGTSFGNDPSGDDFVNFLDAAYDVQEASIVDRYLRFNGHQGNSPEDINAFTTVPDVEDINNDQTMNRIESYYEYKISMRPEDLIVGSNYVSDIRQTTVIAENGQPKNVRWYQFRIPVNSGESIGGINSLRSIQFVRLAMHGFNSRVNLRFGSFDLVRTDWRRYIENLAIDDNGLDDLTNPDPEFSSYDIAGVNLVENSSRVPIPYVLPPGVLREQLFSQTQIQNQNEGSMSLVVDDLETNDARAAYRLSEFDFRRNENLEMFIHLEEQPKNQGQLNPGDVSAFIRLGNDLNNNYYEYEVPLTPTQFGSNSQNLVWPTENSMKIVLQELIGAKLQRDGESYPLTDRYFIENPETGIKIWVKGRPNLANVRSLLVGARNNSLQQQSFEVWFNELRVSGFKNEGGWAASARLDANFADFLNISASTSKSTVGFGAVYLKEVQRSQEDLIQHDFSASFDLGKVITPKKWGLEIPITYNFSEKIIDPRFNPLDQDVEIENLGEQRDSILDIARDYTKRTSVSITNMRKVRVIEPPSPNDTLSNKKPKRTEPRFYDIENVSLNMNYNKTYNSNINTDYAINTNLNSSIDYSYNFKPKFIEPLKNWGAVQDTSKLHKWIGGLKDINFNPVPTKISFRAEIVRNYFEELFRNIDCFECRDPQPIFGYNFQMNYQYNVGLQPFKSLRVDFLTRTNRLVEEIGTFRQININNQNLSVENPDQGLLFSELFNAGRPTNYHQTIRANWQIPINKLPYLDWITADAGYNVDYDWQATSRSFFGSTRTDGTEVNLGNTIQNSNQFNLTGNMNFEELYGKFKSYKKLNKKVREIERRNARNNANVVNNQESSNTPKKKEPKVKLSGREIASLALTSIKSVDLQYTQTNGTVLPGFLDEVDFFGFGGRGPNFGFVVGDQVDIIQRGYLEGWNFTTAPELLDPYQRTHSEQLNYNITVKPIPALSITLNGQRTYTESQNRYNFNARTDTISDNTVGNFNMTYLTFGTAFNNADANFEKFQQNIVDISNRIAGTNSNTTADGFSQSNQSVVIPAFLAAYSGQSSSSVSLNPIKNIPLPNWNLNLSGLEKLPLVRNSVQQMNLKHSYTSSYSVNNFNSNLEYQEARLTGNLEGSRDSNGNFLNSRVYSGISIAERFAPLVGVDVRFKEGGRKQNSLQMSFAYNQDRTLSLSLVNNALTEITGYEFVFGLGYVIKDVSIGKKRNGEKITGPLNIRADVNIRNNLTTIRRIVENDNEITAGQTVTSIKAQAAYDFSRRLTVRAFYDHVINEYAISTAFPTSNIRAGISTQFNF